MEQEEKYWFNTKTNQVEKGLKSSSLNRIGPFETESEAQNAKAIIRERSEAWTKQEKEEDN